MEEKSKAEHEQVESTTPAQPVQKWKRFGRRLFRVLLVLFILFNLSLAIFQIPAVQTWTLQRITTSLSNSLNTTVDVDYFRLGFFNRLVLKGVYVEDLRGDSLLYSEGLEASINVLPLTIIRKGLVINKLRLDDSELYIRRNANDIETNLQLFLNELSNPNKEKKKGKSGFRMNLSDLELGRMKMIKYDSLKNQTFGIGIERASIEICNSDLPNQIFAFQRVDIYEPKVWVDDYIRTPKWDSLLLIPKEVKESELQVTAEVFNIYQGNFIFHNYRKAPVKITPDTIIDYKHMDVHDIKMEVEDFSFARDTFFGKVQCFSLKERSGFAVNDWSAERVYVHPNAVELYGMQFLTAQSRLSDTLRLTYDEYADFIDFTNEVKIDAHFSGSTVAFDDIIAFAPKLNQNSFFIRNRDQRVRIDGVLQGTVNRLNGRKLNIYLDDGSVVKAKMRSRNLAVPGENFINLRFDALDTKVSTLRRWLPRFDVPNNFDRLGKLAFQGSVDILFSDVITDGQLKTDIGEANLDIKIRDIALGKTKTKYSGKIDLNSFNLGVWTGNSDYGLVSVESEVKDGIGLTGSSAFADFSANIKSLVFKDYNYQNALMTGGLKANQFDGNLEIKDNNIDFNFAGKIDLSNGTPIYDFKSTINQLNLYALNFAKEDIRLKGKVDLNLRNKKLANLEGTVTLSDIDITKEDKEVFVDQVTILSKFHQDSIKEVTVKSDVIDGQINGTFNIEKVPFYLGKYIQDKFPLYAYHLGLRKVDTTFSPQVFTYDINIKDTKGVQLLFVDDLKDIRNTRLNGLFSNVDSVFEGSVEMPLLTLGKARAEGIKLGFQIEGSEGDLDLEASGITPNDKITAQPINILSTFKEDSIRFGLTYQNDSEKAALNRLFFDGTLVAIDSSSVGVAMERSQLEIFKEAWMINDQNSILFKEDSIIIKNFTAEQPNRTASLESFSKRGVALSIVNLDFEGLNRQLKYKPLQFDGNFNVTAQSNDIMKLTNIRLVVDSDSLFINGDDWGAMDLVCLMDNAKSPLSTSLTLSKDTSQLILDGDYNVADIGRRPENQKGYFAFDLSLTGFPMYFAEYFIGGTISDATGSFNGMLSFKGTADKPKVFGAIDLNPGGITLDYLKTRYRFGKERVLVDDYFFDISGAKLYDVFGNVATIDGGIRHNHLRDFGFNASLSSDRFQGLNTQKGDNKLFYGQGIGAADLTFTGTFKQPRIYVNATVAEGTNISIPISSEKQASEFGFIRFVDKKKEVAATQQDTTYDLKGVSLDMDLNANNSATMRIIFDEQTGDIIEGRGYGALRISVPRDGDFKMFGNYTIESGDYLFTLYNFINKKFEVQRGGSITWTGDPFTAEIDLTAKYKKVSTSIAPFIQEYLLRASADIQNQASEGTDVDLDLKLTGELLKPTINFDLGFPNLPPELQSYADSKLRLLQLDQNELNKQVFGLIVVGQFLPADFNLEQSSGIISNTLGEFLSNQLSLLLTSLLSEVFGQGRTLSNTDFDIAYSQYQSVDLGTNQNINRGNELEFSLKQNFLNDRISLKGGVNLDLDGSTRATANLNSAFVGNDLIFEVIVNDERTVKVRVYQTLEPDIGGRKLEIGAGLSYRKEFNSFGEFLRSFKRKK